MAETHHTHVLLTCPLPPSETFIVVERIVRTHDHYTQFDLHENDKLDQLPSTTSTHTNSNISRESSTTSSYGVNEKGELVLTSESLANCERRKSKILDPRIQEYLGEDELIEHGNGRLHGDDGSGGEGGFEEEDKLVPMRFIYFIFFNNLYMVFHLIFTLIVVRC